MPQDFTVYVENDKFFISRDDHRRYCDALLVMARVWGDDAADELRKALQAGVTTTLDQTSMYFGRDLPIVQEILKPLLEMISKTLPGFDAWMAVTGLGDDRDFILALINWQRVVVKAPKPSGKDRREIFAGIAAKARLEADDPTIIGLKKKSDPSIVQPEHPVMQ